MFTLTVKPSHFGDDPRRAYLAITDGRFIPRLMKALGVVRWVWVLEFQASGWPHWHLLIDKPGPILDLRKAWRLWGHQHDRWRIGGIDMGQERKSGQEAVGYITKYLVKYPDRGFPDWLLDLDRRVRWVQASRAIGAVVSDADRSEKDVEGRENAAEAAESLPREHASLRVRQASCGQQVDFLREYVNPQTGEVKYLFAGRLRRDLVERSGLLSMIETKGNRAVMADPGNMRVFLAEVVGVAMRQGGPMATLELDMVRRCRPAVDRAKDLRSKSASFDAGR